MFMNNRREQLWVGIFVLIAAGSFFVFRGPV